MIDTDRVRVLREGANINSKTRKVGEVLDWEDSLLRRAFVREGVVELVEAKSQSKEKKSSWGGKGDGDSEQ